MCGVWVGAVRVSCCQSWQTRSSVQVQGVRSSLAFAVRCFSNARQLATSMFLESQSHTEFEHIQQATQETNKKMGPGRGGIVAAAASMALVLLALLVVVAGSGACRVM